MENSEFATDLFQKFDSLIATTDQNLEQIAASKTRAQQLHEELGTLPPDASLTGRSDDIAPSATPSSAETPTKPSYIETPTPSAQVESSHSDRNTSGRSTPDVEKLTDAVPAVGKGASEAEALHDSRLQTALNLLHATEQKLLEMTQVRFTQQCVVLLFV